MQGYVTLADYLMSELRWERNQFGYDGPFPPYIRLDMRWSMYPLRWTACMCPWYNDHIWLRSKFPIADHLLKFSGIQFSRECIEDTLGRATAIDFPCDDWFQFEKMDTTDLILSRRGTTYDILPGLVLSPAGYVRLRI